MFDLALPAEPYWLDLPQGVRLRVRPLDAAVAAAAMARAQRVMREALADHAQAVALGMAEDGPDLTDADTRNGMIAREYAIGLAEAAILAWDGVGASADAPAPCTPETRALFGRTPLALEFTRLYEAPLAVRAAEGNASAPGPNGTTDPGATTAPDASLTASIAPPPAPA